MKRYVRKFEEEILKEDFIELGVFDDLDNEISKFVKNVQKMYDEWYKDSDDFGDDEWDEVGYKSLKDASVAAKKEIVSYVSKQIEKQLKIK